MESPSVAGGGAVNVPTAAAVTATSAPPTPATIVTAYPSPHLKKVLRSYQSAASSSLSGPNGILSTAGHHHHPPPADLVYYSYSNLPLPVVSSSNPVGKAAAAAQLVVKDEPVEDLHHLPYYHCQSPVAPETGGKMCWPNGAGHVDEFKVWKLKRPAYISSKVRTAASPFGKLLDGQPIFYSRMEFLLDGSSWVFFSFLALGCRGLVSGSGQSGRVGCCYPSGTGGRHRADETVIPPSGPATTAASHPDQPRAVLPYFERSGSGLEVRREERDDAGRPPDRLLRGGRGAPALPSPDPQLGPPPVPHRPDPRRLRRTPDQLLPVHS